MKTDEKQRKREGGGAPWGPLGPPRGVGPLGEPMGPAAGGPKGPQRAPPPLFSFVFVFVFFLLFIGFQRFSLIFLDFLHWLS